MHNYNYNDLLLFAKVVEFGTFANSAAQQNTTQSQISRKMKLLEQDLDIKLFQFQGRKYILTKEGAELYRQLCIHMRSVNELDNTLNLLKHNNVLPNGELCIILPTGISFYLITPYLYKFTEQYPDIRLIIIYQDSIADFDMVLQDYDVIINNYLPDRPHQNSYKVTKLITAEIGLYCTPQYIERYGKPEKPLDLLQHKIIGNIRTDKLRTNKLEIKHTKTKESEIINLNSRIFINNNLNTIQFVHSNEFLVGLHNLKQHQGLVRVLPDYEINDAENSFNSLYLIRHPYKDNIAIRLFLDFIKHLFKLHKVQSNNMEHDISEFLKIQAAEILIHK